MSSVKGRRKITVYLEGNLLMYNMGAILIAAPLLPRGGKCGTGKASIRKACKLIPGGKVDTRMIL